MPIGSSHYMTPVRNIPRSQCQGEESVSRQSPPWGSKPPNGVCILRIQKQCDLSRCPSLKQIMGRTHSEDSFCRIQPYKLKLNLKKCIFATPEIQYLGYTISAGSLKPGKEKTQAVKEFPAPKSVKEIQHFTGLTNYFRAVIPGYAKLAGKLTKLVAKESGWGEGNLPSDAPEALKCLREKLT